MIAEPETAEAPLRSYACRIRGSDHETTVHARSPGAAKWTFLFHLDGFEFTDVRVRVLGPPVTTDRIERNAKRRGVPFVRAGMRVRVGDEWGVIVNSNSSANWDVLFDKSSRFSERVMNCHPHSQIAYFDESGELIKEFPEP